MKSERRHELQHNTLADWLFKSAEAIKPYQNLILAAATALVVGVAAITWWSHHSTSQATQAWTDFYKVLETGDQSKLARVRESYPDSEVSDAAALVSADLYFSNGCQQLFLSKALGLPELKKAAALYETVMREGKTPFLKARATLGLARTKEAYACGEEGSIQEAEKYYQEVVAKWPKGGCATLASQRLDKLKQPETKQLYEDLRLTFDPKPTYSGTSSSSDKFEPLPDLKPGDLPNNPPAGSLDPSFLDKKIEGLDKDKPTDKKEKPADTAKPAEDTKPAPEKTAPEKADK